PGACAPPLPNQVVTNDTSSCRFDVVRDHFRLMRWQLTRRVQTWTLCAPDVEKCSVDPPAVWVPVTPHQVIVDGPRGRWIPTSWEVSQNKTTDGDDERPATGRRGHYAETCNASSSAMHRAGTRQRWSS